jgi:hypothetical protein
MKRVTKFSSWEEQPINDLAYWLSIPPMQRVAAIQILRQQLYLIKPSPKNDGTMVRKFSGIVE